MIHGRRDSDKSNSTMPEVHVSRAVLPLPPVSPVVISPTEPFPVTNLLQLPQDRYNVRRLLKDLSSEEFVLGVQSDKRDLYDGL